MTLKRGIHLTIKSILVIFILFSSQLHAQLMPSLIGDANDIGGDCFEITENINFQSGAIWSGTPIDMTNDFVIEFRGFFGTNDANGADGITFILKNNAAPQIGNPGGGMGYEGIGNSLAVEFDTWQNNELGDPFFDHIGIVSNGNNNHNAGTSLAGPIQASATSTNIEDGVEHIIRIEWTAATTTIDVYFDCVLRLSFSGNIVNTLFGGNTNAFFGFTGSTGGAVNLQRVCFDYVSFANSLSLNDQNICPGNIVDSIDATVTGATSYTWTPITGVSNPSIPNPTFSPTTTTTYTVSITNSCAEIIQESFTITLDPLPIANPINDFAVCDDLTNDGTVPFNFTNLDSTVLGTQDPNIYDVSYHLSLSDANGNLNPLTFPYNNTLQCEEIFVRIQNSSNIACFATTSFEVCVNTQPNANQPNDMIACDIGNDGTETFNLSLQEPDILGTQNTADVNITFHASQIDAANDANPLATMYNGTDSEFIFIRVESTEVGNDCFAISSFQLFVNETPIANTVADFSVCDDASNDGINAFDFSNLNITVLGTQDPNLFSVTYHLSQLDADNGVNALVFPYTNTAQCERIYVRVENDTNSACLATTNFEVCVNTQPIANQPNEIMVCDTGNDNVEMIDLLQQEADILGTQNATDFNISFHANQTDATNDASPLSTMYNGINNEIIFVRIESTEVGNDCFATTSFQILLNEIPVANPIADFSVCDDASNDGVNAFNFSNLDLLALGTQDPNLFLVTYHLNQLDANDGVNALVFPYTNTAQCERIYVRVESIANPDCADTTNFEVCLNTQPVANQPNNMIACDFDNDGSEIFDLSQQETDILGGQNAADFNISFHANPLDANNNVNPLPTLYNGSNNETISVRVESTEVGNDCYAITDFDLIFDSPPTITIPTNLIVCDDDVSDGFTAIDLNIKNAEIIGTQTGLSVQYYLSQADAENNNNPLVSPYTNISNPQMIFARVENGITGCFSITNFNIVVSESPVANVPTALEYCDTDNDGFGIFDIRSTENEVTGGMTTDILVTYHETPEDADNDVNPLPDTYTNINADMQTIYVRAENVLTGCFNVVPLDLIVNDAPEIAALDAATLEECDTDTDGIAQFDLTLSEADILNGEDPLTHPVRYYNTLANANLGTGAGEINNVNAYSNITPNSQVIWVRVDDLTTSCFRVTNLTLIVNELPALVQLPGLETCDAVSLNDGIEVFDLSSLSEQLLNNAPGISLDYFANAADLASNTPITDPAAYSNTEIGVQTIFVLATNDTTGCQNTITFNITVNPLPSPTLNPNGMLVADICDEDNDGFQLFD
uniref:L-type lectin-domain containing protein n=1 Tax=Kordia jejudonensis TaxID=1348245 RepID=UPI000AF70A0B